jgi:uncharacterized membrane protein (GlpM family)
MSGSLFLWKCVSLPLVVVLISWVQKRWGHRVGGMVTGLPTTAAFITIFLAIEQGPAYAQNSANGTLAGMLATAAFARSFLYFAKSRSWAICLAAGMLAFFITLGILYLLSPPLIINIGLGVVTIILFKTIPKSDSAIRVVQRGRWDLAVRAAGALAVLLLVTALAYVLPPEFSGLLAAFPIVYSTLFSFTLVESGREAIVQFLHGAALGLFGFIAFFIVVHFWPFESRIGVFSLAFVAALAIAGIAQALGHIYEKQRKAA